MRSTGCVGHVKKVEARARDVLNPSIPVTAVPTVIETVTGKIETVVTTDVIVTGALMDEVRGPVRTKEGAGRDTDKPVRLPVEVEVGSKGLCPANPLWKPRQTSMSYS
jgi:hypothetical protein